jgi:hypothetical protein
MSAAITSAISCAANTSATVQHAFMTSDEYNGDLVAAAGDATLDGPAAADLLCNRAAANANRGGTWTAWISVGDGTNLGYDPNDPTYLAAYPHASYRTAAIDRIVGDGPWFNMSPDPIAGRPSESLMFADRNALVTGAMGDIWYTEYIELPDAGAGVTTWTGTRTDGQPTSWDCTGWTTAVVDLTSQDLGSAAPDLGVAGAEDDSDDSIDIGPTWTDDAELSCFDEPNERCPGYPAPVDRDAAGWGAISCNDPAHLYCFEDDPSS